MSTDKTELFNPDSLIDWLRQQDPDEEYVWQDPVNCLVGRYRAAHGLHWGDVQYSLLPNYEQIAHEKPWTYGAALQRAEALKQLPPPVPAMTIDAIKGSDYEAVESPAQSASETLALPQLRSGADSGERGTRELR